VRDYDCGHIDRKNIRVLIADDAPRSRAGLRALLASIRMDATEVPWAGATGPVEVVGEAKDGREALRLVAECQPDVVLMDARMPVMDGLEATRLIKDRWPEVKIVILTLYPTYRAQARAAGADAFLVKGCQPEELLESIFKPGKGEP
jgi:DNA-binding NarL/FixJ family response regulator